MRMRPKVSVPCHRALHVPAPGDVDSSSSHSSFCEFRHSPEYQGYRFNVSGRTGAQPSNVMLVRLALDGITQWMFMWHIILIIYHHSTLRQPPTQVQDKTDHRQPIPVTSSARGARTGESQPIPYEGRTVTNLRQPFPINALFDNCQQLKKWQSLRKLVILNVSKIVINMQRIKALECGLCAILKCNPCVPVWGQNFKTWRDKLATFWNFALWIVSLEVEISYVGLGGKPLSYSRGGYSTITKS